MQLKNTYWYFEKILPFEFCDKIINLAKTKQEKTALVGTTSQEKEKEMLLNEEYSKNLNKQRNSNVVWLSEQWIYDVINDLVNKANVNAGWNFQWDWNECCQFTIYKENQHYDWHVDSFPNPYDNPDEENLFGKIRKLSCVISLSDPKDYEGGNFLFKIPSHQEEDQTYYCKEIKEKGSVLVFPSFIKHKVEPVTKGIRYSLVNWSLGRPFN